MQPVPGAHHGEALTPRVVPQVLLVGLLPETKGRTLEQMLGYFVQITGDRSKETQEIAQRSQQLHASTLRDHEAGPPAAVEGAPPGGAPPPPSSSSSSAAEDAAHPPPPPPPPR